MIINGLKNLKELFQDIFLSTHKEFPCKDCIILPLGCSAICDRVEMDEKELTVHFNKTKVYVQIVVDMWI